MSDLMPGIIESGKVTLRGEGIVTVFPDLAVIRLGVISEGDSLTNLQSENGLLVNNVVNALEKVGANDISTFNYMVDKNYIYENGIRIDQGYKVRNIIDIRTFDMDSVGVIIDTAVANGANQVELVSFQISNPSEYYQEALNLAIMDGMDKARNISETFGFNINLLPVNIVEEWELEESPRTFNMAREAGQVSPILPGDQRITANVTIEFAIG